MTRHALVLVFVLATSAWAEWWNVSGPAPGPVPVSNPVCVSGCQDSSSSSSSQRQTRSAPDPQEEARRAAAAAAAAREEARRAEEARREYEASRRETRRMDALGAEARARAQRLAEERDRLEQREARIRSLQRSLAPVGVQKPAPGNRTPLSMKAYCDQLNAAAAPGRGLRPSEVPALPTVVGPASFEVPPEVGPDRFAHAVSVIQRGGALLHEEAKEDVLAVSWKLIERRAPFLAKAHDLLESGQQTYKAMTEMTSRLATNVLTHATNVARTLGGAGGRVTEEDDQQVFGSLVRDVDETTAKQLAEKTNAALKDKVLDKSLGWPWKRETP